MALIHLAALAFPPDGHPGHVFERLIAGTTDPHLRWSFITTPPKNVQEALERAATFAAAPSLAPTLQTYIPGYQPPTPFQTAPLPAPIPFQLPPQPAPIPFQKPPQPAPPAINPTVPTYWQPKERLQFHQDPNQCGYCRKFGKQAMHCGHSQGKCALPITALSTL